MAMTPSLADRLRAVVGGVPTVPRVHPDAGGPGPAAPQDRARAAAGVLGGVVDDRAEGASIVVDRVYAADVRHGWHTIGDIVAALRRAEDGVTALRRAWPAASSAAADAPDVEGLCAIDLETTGLAGGAGTQAFLVGCARLAGDGIHVRQFLLPGFEGERAQLAALAEWMRDRTQLVTFNGRSFDLPLLEMRFNYQRVAWPWPDVAHLDALHPARRFWRDRGEAAGFVPDDASCSLAVLERRLAGVHRVGDVAGFDIPARFFQFVRDGRAEPLAAVLEHNRLDLVSTLLVCARAASLVVGGPSAAERGQECLGLGRVYERLEDPAAAEACYARAAAEGLGLGDAGLRAESLWRLALLQRRAGRQREAAATWQALLATRGAAVRLRREAREALAIHHEHRVRDLDGARTLVLEGLDDLGNDRQRARAAHRLARLERKLDRARPGGLIACFDDDSSGQSNQLD
jgi:uncharacterized protein YprB with RNaseH-like and TPR domain